MKTVDELPITTKRLRTNRKLLAAEIKKLTALSAMKVDNAHSRTAMCLGAVYAIGWVLGECETPTEKIAAALQKGRHA
jgi:hypothetical protein